MKLVSQTDQLTESLRRQKMTFSQMISSRKALGDVYREQIALQQATSATWGTDAKGRMKMDLFIPQGLDSSLRSLSSRVGYFNQLLSIGADQMVKWGKNMQWAGRQLSMGFTMPVILAGAVMGKFAYDVDKALTQVVKVYGDATSEFQESNETIREDTMRTAKMMTSMYGQAATDTIEITAQLAAAGRTGKQLQADTAAVTRARVLGELDLQDAMKATITMQSVYHYNAEQLGDAFNYINAMENQTVLTAQDFVTAIPKVSGVMNTLGGDLKDVGALMTAFKAAGIDAAEGANALKSINFRLVATYTKGLKTFQAATGQSLSDIVAQTGGKTVPTLMKFADAIKNLSAVQKVAVTRDVFGIYQGSKALTMLEQLTGQTEQLSRALAVGKNSVEENALIAAKEIQTLNAQPFMKLKKAVQEFRNSLVDMGEEFVKVAAPIINKLTTIVHWFQSLPDIIKKFGIGAIIGIAVAGPIIMLVGLFANLAGQGIKLVTSITKLIIPFKLLTAEEAAQAIAAKRSIIQWNDQATVLGKVTRMVDLYTGALGRNTAAQAASNRMLSLSQRVAAGSAASRITVAGAGTAGRSAATTSRVAGGGLMTAGMLGGMVSPAGSAGSSISGTLMTLGMLNMLIPSVGVKLGALGKTGAAAFTRRLGPAVDVVKKGIMSLASIAGPAGIALAAVAGSALFVWSRYNKEIAETQRRMDAISNSAKDWAEILGFGYTQGSPLARQKNSEMDILEQQVDMIKEKNADLYKALSDMSKNSEADKIAAAINEGMKVRLHGGSVAAAENAARAAMAIMGEKLSAAELRVKIAPEVDFSDWDSVAQRATADLQDTMDKAMKGAFNTKDGPMETFVRYFSGTRDLNSVAKAQLQDKMDQFYQIFSGLEGDSRKAAFEKIRQMASQDLVNVYNSIDVNARKQVGINTFGDFLKAAEESANSGGPMASSNKLAQITGLDPNFKLGPDFKKDTELYFATLKAFAMANGMNEKDANKLYNFTQIADDAGVEVKELGNEMNRTGNYGQFYSGAVGYAAGATTEFSVAADGASIQAQQLEDDIANLNDRMQNTGVSWDSISSAMKDAMAKSMEVVTKVGDDAFSAANDAAMDVVKARGQAALDAIDKQADALDKKVDDMKARHDEEEKTLNDSYDKRIAKVDEAIDAEQKAEEIRQRIFEAEKSRLERMSAMANNTIDFQSALRSGNLDEAARVQTAALGQQMQWALDDAGQSSADASKKRLDDLNTQKDALSDAKKTALDALKQKQADEDEKLKIENEARKKSIEADKKAQERKNKIAEDNAKAYAETQQWKMKSELDAITAIIPRTAKERDKQIEEIKKVYNKYGVDLKAFGGEWASIIANELTTQVGIAGQQLKNTVDWATVGSDIISDMIYGGMGMTVSQFTSFLESGKWPDSAKPPTKGELKRARTAAIAKTKANPNMAFHAGGIVGMGGGRVGFASNAPRSAREIDTRLLAGEGVLNRGAIKTLGTDFVDKVNNGKIPSGVGGPDLISGMAGMLGAAAAAAAKASAMAGISNAYNQALATSDSMDLSTSAIAGKAGKYGGSRFDATQLQNAATIISVGKSLGASNRDLIIALMTSMQESTLRNLNYGDRDSLGLFQQRNAWGSAADRTNPVEATKMFFRGGHGGQRGLFAFKNRDQMTLAQAAQAVQVSAFPDAYAKWEDEARAILSGTSIIQSGTGSFTKPLSSYRLSSGYGYRIHPITGKRTFHDGIDMAAPSGSPIRAALNGKVAYAGWNGGYGNYTAIQSGNLLVGYGHQSRIGVHRGQNVGQGSVIGLVGSTGASTGPHLHLLTKRDGKSIDPRSVFPGLLKGGFTLNDGYAKLHKKEAVLTAPLSQKLKDGINNLDKSVHSRYDITVDNRGAVFNTEVDFQKSVEKAIAKADQRRGVSRSVR